MFLDKSEQKFLKNYEEIVKSFVKWYVNIWACDITYKSSEKRQVNVNIEIRLVNISRADITQERKSL